MKKLVCAMLLILSAGYAIDYEQLEMECRDFKDMQSCKKLLYYNKSLCDKGNDIACQNLGLFYASGAYGIAKNNVMALKYLEPLCDKGFNEAMTCRWVGAAYILLKLEGMGEKYMRKSCNVGDEIACQFVEEWFSR